ncbi:MAG: ATP-binding protein [Bdellovibrionaceae bacterium]|nr:ATP-binding protein [Pseudobdellovibrionaceae bacterium]
MSHPVYNDPKQAIKLVLTGGPSGGKTTLAQAVVREFSEKVIVVPEAASILFGGGWPRRKTPKGVTHQQKAIFFVQREVEELLTEEHPDKLLICDRGSLDGMAYWPDRTRPQGYLDAVNTDVATEASRYDWVLHLDTAPVAGYDTTNPLRNESHEEALRLNERIREAWKIHPQRFIVGTAKSGHFIDKLKRALLIVEKILDGHTYEEINASLKE